MTRREQREQSFILIFERIFNPDISIEELYNSGCDMEVISADDFSLSLAKKAVECEGEIDNVFSPYLRNWTIARLPRVSLAIIRLAVCEMLYFNDIPASVSINEAVELGKKYAVKRDTSFINAILGSVASSLQKNVAEREQLSQEETSAVKEEEQ